MTSSYRDRAGTYHIFADSFDPNRETAFDDPLSSWDAVQRYYTTEDFGRHEDLGVAVDRGRWTGDPGSSDGDCVGAGSPGVTVAGGRVLLFYAGRGPTDPAGPFERTMNRADLPGRIMLATAAADEAGAPDGPFQKHGPVTDYKAPWRSIRHDDPRPVVTEDEVLLFYKGIGPGSTYANRVIGLARAPVDCPTGPYHLEPEPVLRTDRGCESPRVFRVGDVWHMFVLRYSRPGSRRNRSYGHYMATDPFSWELVDDELYVTTSDAPGNGAADMCPIWTPFDSNPPELAFGNRLDDGTFGDPGVFKQWLWRIEQR